MLVLPFHTIDPYIVRFGPLGVTWYSLAYVVGVLFAWGYAVRICAKFKIGITPAQLEKFVSWAIFGLIIGGRLGYVLLYDPLYYLTNPIKILKVYEGGMSFHGGLLGVIYAAHSFCKSEGIYFFNLTDVLSLVVPVGLFLGRIANFINGEHYGKYSDLPWAVKFPDGGYIPRHPSQLYEALAEGVVLFLILNFAAYKKIDPAKHPSLISAYFIILYGFARIFCEFFRVPDFVFLNMSSGQLYSIPMILGGLYLIYKYKKCN